MKSEQQIRDELETEFSTLTEIVNGVEIALTTKQRSALLDKWAKERASVTADPTEQLKSARAAMSAILAELPVHLRAVTQSFRPAVENALDRGDIEAARWIVENADIPDDLKPTQNAILALFPHAS